VIKLTKSQITPFEVIHVINVIRVTQAQNDHIKPLLLYNQMGLIWDRESPITLIDDNN
jgi:hypothetical protein